LGVIRGMQRGDSRRIPDNVMALIWIVLGLIYILSPYDLIPDFIPVDGWIDDLVVLALLVRYIIHLWRRAANAERQAGGSTHQTGGAREEKEKTSPQPRRAPKDPYEILGVPPHAGREEIRSAYRKLAGRYHPDKVAHLGKEFQELAEKRFKEIQNAYDLLAKNR
jgi:uncharacterized membrane protein YkvA (DUF1232 family)